MPSLPDGLVIFVLALLLLGPKKLPALARELGKWIGEFRRASNEFKMQMEEEMRVVERADREREVAAIAAAAPPAAALPGIPLTEPEHPHRDPDFAANDAEAVLERSIAAPEPLPPTDSASTHASTAADPTPPHTPAHPIATSGELQMMPPATGLPTAATAASSFFDSIPAAPAAAPSHPAETPTPHA